MIADSYNNLKTVISACVVFSGRADLPWLRLLRPGFRHCFLVMRFPDFWLMYEPLSTRTEFTIIPHRPNLNLFDWLRQMRFTVMPAHIDPCRSGTAPWGPFTCVEAVKRALGIRARRILTPWRLYKFLREQNKKILDSRD